ncbi:MAG TPA: lysophospholipid acyltransferase family protein [Longimicrobiales bacterium]|nr:lysophospholipid acyltransferase family protein [Longimicrobiales bacterium]
MSKLRGYVALAVVCLSLVVLDPLQRLFVAPWVRLVPSRRIPLLTRWQRFLARVVLDPVEKIGGARISELPRVPGGPGVLVLMNHQSVLDIPLVVSSIHGAYPRIVTRKRYMRWIPLISHMVRLYQYPVVDPSANAGEGKRMLGGISEAAATSDVPMAIFPEGTRTRTGDIARFRSTGLKLILAQRPWTVYVLVADGFWQRAKLKHFLGGMSQIHGQVTMQGPFHWTDPTADSQPFIEEMRDRMVSRLGEMRGTPAV